MAVEADGNESGGLCDARLAAFGSCCGIRFFADSSFLVGARVKSGPCLYAEVFGADVVFVPDVGWCSSWSGAQEGERGVRAARAEAGARSAVSGARDAAHRARVA